MSKQTFRPAAPLTALSLAIALVCGTQVVQAQEASQAPLPTISDPCAGNMRCYASGPVVADVVQLISAQKERNNHSVRVSVRLRNISDQPIALGYKTNSGTMLDNLGHEYKVDWRNDSNVAGIGQVSRTKADPQFTLRPGEARTATFNYSRYVGKTAMGTVFNPSLVVAQLEVIPGNQVRSVSEYSINFTNIAPGNFNNPVSSIDDAGRQLAEGLKSIFKQK